VSLGVLKAELDALEARVTKVEDHADRIEAALNLGLRQQAWILGLGTGIGAIGMLVLQKVFA